MYTNRKLRDMREDMDITQKKVAGMLNLTLSGYSRKENGNRGFTIEEAKKLAKIFHVTMDELF